MKKASIFALSLLLPCATTMAMKKAKSFFQIRKKSTVAPQLKRSRSFFQIMNPEPTGETRWCFCRKNPKGQSVIDLIRCVRYNSCVVKNILRLTVSKTGGDCTAIVTPSPYILPLDDNLLKNKKALLLPELMGYDRDAREGIRRASESAKNKKSGRGKVIYVEKGMAKAQLQKKLGTEKVLQDDFPYKKIKHITIAQK